MKKSLFSVTVAAFLLGLGCSGTQAEDKIINWKLAHDQPIDSLTDKIAKAVKQEIEKKSNGAIKIALYPANQLGDWTEVSEQIMRGVVDMGILPVPSAYDARLQVRVLPYSVMNWDAARKAYLGEDPYLFNIMANAMDKTGLKALSVVAIGFGGGGCSSVPNFDLVDPNANKQGYKMRFPPGNRAWESLVTAFGFIPTPIPWTELYVAQQTKLVNCQIGSGPFATWSSFRDITKVWVQYNTHFQNNFVFMNKKAWEALKPEQQKIVQDVTTKYSDESFSSAMAEDQQYRELMAKAGIKVILPTDEQIKILAKKARETVWSDVDKIIGKEIMDVMRKH